METKSREEYAKRKIRYFTEKNCPFCSKEIENNNEIIHKTNYWKIIYNKYPYFWDKNWLIAIPIRHVDLTSKLTTEEYWDFFNVQNFMKSYFKKEEYFSFIRETKSNKSIEHLHYHFIIWSVSLEKINWNKQFIIK